VGVKLLDRGKGYRQWIWMKQGLIGLFKLSTEVLDVEAVVKFCLNRGKLYEPEIHICKDC
jgi:hypothetical protein